MLSFRNDYSEGAHPSVLRTLEAINLEQMPGYGLDRCCQDAADAIRTLCAAPEADVHFLVGGTQVNKTAIAAFLRPYEAAIAAESGHICTHETGAVEQDGHKILTVPTADGKLTPALLQGVLESHSSEHMVLPRLVYLSNTTELGTVYSLEELSAISEFCQKNGLILYCDGARLGAAMVAGDTTFTDYASLCDAFTIGGTKNGLLFGEALIIVRPSLQAHFRWCMKQQGAVLAKGWLLGLQFSAILQNDLYLELARHAMAEADKIRAALQELGIPCLVDSPSNQLFPILPLEKAAAFQAACACEAQQKVGDDGLCVRLVTSWATKDSDVNALVKLLRSL